MQGGVNNMNPAMTGNLPVNQMTGNMPVGGMPAPMNHMPGMNNTGMGVPQNTMGMTQPQFGAQGTQAPYNFQNTQMNMNPQVMGQTGSMQVQPIPGVTQNTAPSPEPTTFGGGLRGVAPLTSRVESRQIKIPDFLKK